MRRARPPRQAPEFPDGLEWLNIETPLNLSMLRRKIVLLSFWTYGCINCLHLDPDLRRLLAKYREDLAVIGVHSARFEAEAEMQNLRSAVLRHEIDYPVVNDREMRIWQDYGVRAWPTTALLDPFGKIIDQRSGERVFDAYDAMIQRMITQYGPSGHIDHTPLPGGHERQAAVEGVLSFPAKVVADERSGRLFIADTKHNRIVICSLDGEVLDIAGSGEAGLQDGSFDEARFYRPHGMALDGSVLYVADTENHCMRRMDLVRRTVVTVAGTGMQAPIFAERGRGTRDPMNSPWDLELADDWLIIAMAGSHQIWRMRLRTYEFEAFAGGGREDLIDGRRSEASLAQPTGLCSDGRRLYFADSQSSAVRSAHLPPTSSVDTLVGRGRFEYGDRDGAGPDALLQHPRGVAYCAGDIYVADTYNHKIKRLNPGTGRIETIAGTGEPGLRDGDSARFHEPGGLDCAGGRIFIADTNNNAIRILPLAGGPVTTLELHPLSRLAPPATAGGPLKPRELPEHRVRAGAGSITISLGTGPAHALNMETPIELQLRIEGEAIKLEHAVTEFALPPTDLPLTMPALMTAGLAVIRLRLRFHYHCAEVRGAAYFEDIHLDAPVSITEDAPSGDVGLTYSLEDRLRRR